jgi:hypothetical protein
MTRTVLLAANCSPDISRRGAFESRANRLISRITSTTTTIPNWDNTSSAAALSFEPPPHARERVASSRHQRYIMAVATGPHSFTAYLATRSWVAKNCLPVYQRCDLPART